MKPENAIEVCNIEKDFKVYSDRGKWLKDIVVTRGRNKYELRHVLKGISFEVKKGEAIGLIGKNGCGKSTTLKLLSKIIRPNKGSIEIQGRVSSLLELGAGFHPDLSGKKNIYMNAAIFGLTKKEIDDRLDDIIKFSELGEFIDNPIRTYSSGMYMRLAFSVAINVDADILLIDEILAVGDVSFQTKCFEKLKEIKASGTTIIIVSHSLDQIEKICNRSIWIEDGVIKEEGQPHEIHHHYLYEMEKNRLSKIEADYYEQITEKEDTQTEEEVPALEDESTFGEKAEPPKIKKYKRNILNTKNLEQFRGGNRQVVFTDFYLLNGSEEETLTFETGEKMRLLLFYSAQGGNRTGTVYFDIYNDSGVLCYSTNSFYETLDYVSFQEKGHIEIEICKCNLLPGKYFLGIGAYDEAAVRYDNIDNCVEFQVMSVKGDMGICRLDTEWMIMN